MSTLHSQGKQKSLFIGWCKAFHKILRQIPSEKRGLVFLWINAALDTTSPENSSNQSDFLDACLNLKCNYNHLVLLTKIIDYLKEHNQQDIITIIESASQKAEAHLLNKQELDYNKILSLDLEKMLINFLDKLEPKTSIDKDNVLAQVKELFKLYKTEEENDTNKMYILLVAYSWYNQQISIALHDFNQQKDFTTRLNGLRKKFDNSILLENKTLSEELFDKGISLANAAFNKRFTAGPLTNQDKKYLPSTFATSAGIFSGLFGLDR